MFTKKNIIIVLSFIIILTGIRFLWMFTFMAPDHPHASQGILDLRHWEPFTEHTVSLDGEWEFYPNRFLVNGDGHAQGKDNSTTFIQVPSNWQDVTGKSNAYGFATYRLHILINSDHGRTFGIRFPNVASSSEVFMNGESIAQIGKPAEEKQLYTASNKAYMTYFTVENTNEIELIVQVANFDHPHEGGIVQSLTFGLAETFTKETYLANSVVIIACVVYLLHALYSFILFFIGTRDVRFLYFSFMIVGIVSATLFSERLWYEWSPFSYEWDIKIFYLTVIAGGYSFFQCMKHLLSEGFRTYLVMPYTILCSLAGLLILFLPATFNIMIHWSYLIVMLIPCLLAPLLLSKISDAANQDRIYLLLAAIAAIGSLIWLILIETLYIEVISYPIDLMIATMCFSIYWFKRYFRILAESQDLAHKLKQADKEKDEFLVTIAHEMRNPLHGILNISQSIIEREKTIPEKNNTQDLELIVTIGRHMSMLVDVLLDLERLKQNRLVIRPKNVSMHSITEAVMNMVRFMSDKRKIRLVNRIPNDFPLVYADQNRIIQILFNLLINAVTHSQAQQVSVDAAVHREWVHISVSDNGIGIDEVFLERLFTRFEQGTNEFSTIQDGLGLGLSICKQLVKMHGGSLTVRSKKHQGTTFTFTLPLSNVTDVPEVSVSAAPTLALDYEQTAAASSEIEAEDAKAAANPIRILAVDDDPVNLKVLESIFSMDRYDVHSALSGQEALSMLDGGDWDLMIADVMMPQMSGYELTQNVRQRFSILELPVLLITARSQPEDVVSGFLSGANDYVAKPIEGVELRARINTLADLKRSTHERIRMEAALFQAQIQPHFLFNTINTIAALGEIDTKRMTNLLIEFGNYLRKSFDRKNLERLVPLDHELDLLKSYVFIEKQRFGERLTVLWEIDEHIKLGIPPLSIQPLVENAIRHGVLKRKEGGTVRIRVAGHDQSVEIAIIDDGVGMSEEQVQELLQSNGKFGVGIYNTNWRLKQLYGKGIEIISSPNQGTTVRFYVPL